MTLNERNKPMRSKRTFLTGLIIILFSYILWPVKITAGDIPIISKDVLKEKLDDPEVVVIDVRARKDWEASPFKIRGAVRENAADFKSWATKYSNEKTIVAYCA
jgi:hypothetical protein